MAKTDKEKYEKLEEEFRMLYQKQGHLIKKLRTGINEVQNLQERMRRLVYKMQQIQKQRVEVVAAADPLDCLAALSDEIAFGHISDNDKC